MGSRRRRRPTNRRPAGTEGRIGAARTERGVASAERSEVDRGRGQARLIGAAGLLDQRGLTRVVEIDAVAARSAGAARGPCAVSHLLLERDAGPPRADDRFALDQRDARLRAARVDVEHGAAHSDRGGRRLNDVRPLVERAGGEAEDALGQVDRHLLPADLAGIDKLVERHP